LGVFPATGSEPGRLIRLFDGELPDSKVDRKRQKPDLEALTLLPPGGNHPHGALLALDTARSDESVGSFVLWQPVTSGEAMLTQFLQRKLPLIPTGTAFSWGYIDDIARAGASRPALLAGLTGLEAGSDIEVVELRVERSAGVRLAGTLRNKTTRTIASAYISCDLTDADGTQLGAVSIHVENIPPSGVRNFDQPLKQASAAFVLVREILAR
jgi:hypothetical protein